MTLQEQRLAWMKVRALVTEIIGFHDLAEREDHPPTGLQRTIYDAHVYASGVTLALTLNELAACGED
ncbi:MAG: hypothetical protein K5872_02615 [Rhizobiaceae bacterium]|nr:hypothetical protein [Rhizobiaceae bacterium]MCV0405103.1 hypothetical protein [Rhizobiaceae bacterium]